VRKLLDRVLTTYAVIGLWLRGNTSRNFGLIGDSRAFPRFSALALASEA
jgi:hypothetical protein